MREKYKLFRESLVLVWQSAPGWALVNTLVSVIRSFTPLALLLLIKILVDQITLTVSDTGDKSINDIIGIIAAVVILYFIDEAVSDFGNYVKKKQSMKLEIHMYNLLHSKAVKLDLINFEYPGYFDLLTRAAREAPWRPNSILNNLILMMRALLSLIMMAFLLVSLHWTMALLLFVVNIPGIWLRLHYADVLYTFQREQTPESRRSAYFNWLITGERPSRELRLFGLGEYFISLFRKSFLSVKEEEINIARKRMLIEIVSDIVKAAAMLFLILFTVNKTINNSLTLGEMAMFLLAFRQGMIFIKELFGSLAGLYEDSLFIGDTFEFLSLEEKITAAPPVVSVSTLMKNIEVENLSFTYPGNKSPAINNVSFEIKKGEILAVVGPNGGGKSTLVRLLTRLYDPATGSVRIDGNNIRNIDPEKYRRLFSVVFQDFMLYNLRAGENIRIGDLDSADPEIKIKKAALESGVHELISSLPEGYDTNIGTLLDDSRELSWGEWQKIALARAIFRDAPVLILDEPSSALDADTEFEIFSRFRETVSDRTAILISHRFTNVSLADKIIVLDRGEIIESGTHGELMKKGGLYFAMYTKQNSRFER